VVGTVMSKILIWYVCSSEGVQGTVLKYASGHEVISPDSMDLSLCIAF